MSRSNLKETDGKKLYGHRVLTRRRDAIAEQSFEAEAAPAKVMDLCGSITAEEAERMFREIEEAFERGN